MKIGTLIFEIVIPTINMYQLYSCQYQLSTWAFIKSISLQSLLLIGLSRTTFQFNLNNLVQTIILTATTVSLYLQKLIELIIQPSAHISSYGLFVNNCLEFLVITNTMVMLLHVLMVCHYRYNDWQYCEEQKIKMGSKVQESMFRDSDQQWDGLECTICLDLFKEQQLVWTVVDCQHGFHPTCIREWLKNQKKCPLCRRYIDCYIE